MNNYDLVGKDAHIVSINISKKKGTKKKSVGEESVNVMLDFGIENDAHAGDWHRQVSFLASESIQKVKQAGIEVQPGSFAENFTTKDVDLKNIPMGTILKLGDEVEVEISQIGKVCHTKCAIYHLMGDCIFPHEGIFAIVRKSGKVSAGDKIELLKLGDGTCDATPKQALEELRAAREEGQI